MLRALDEGLWAIDQDFSMPGGIQIGTRTTVIRLSTGGLFVHALGPLDESLQSEVSKLGEVAALVAPNLFHNAYVKDWVAAYPSATCYASRGFDKKVNGLEHVDLTNRAPEIWSADLLQVVVEGAPQLGEVVFFHRATRTLLLTDLCFNMRHSESFITRLVMRMMGGYGHFGPSRLARSFMKDKAAVRSGIERILEWDFDRVTVTHGEVLDNDGHALFEKAYAWLLL